MFKKLYLPLTLEALLLALAILFSPITASTTRITDIKNNLTHITQAKKDILTEQETLFSDYKNILENFHQDSLGHSIDVTQYKELTRKIVSIVDSIAASDNFKHVINYCTDFQVTCIADKQIAYHDIKYTPEAYPIEQKLLIRTIDEAFANASFAKYTDGELLFNIHYLQATQNLGYNFLLKKLNFKEQSLITELTALEAAHA